MAEEEVTGSEQAAQVPTQQFSMQRVFVKDLSFESPSAPAVFRQEWRPSMNVDLRNQSRAIDEENYEVVLTITVTAKLGEETAYLAEVQQGGIFLVRGIEGEDLRRVLSILCPNMLFPYARETLDTVVTKGTFPAVMLAQVNFESLYQAAVQQAQQNAEGAPAASEEEAAS
jgi:preprotein translocase subunit SecB